MCDCLDRYAEVLDPLNTRIGIVQVVRLDQEFDESQTRVEIATYKLDPRDKRPRQKVVPKYCPFCGERYQVEEFPAVLPEEESSEEAPPPVAAVPTLDL